MTMFLQISNADENQFLPNSNPMGVSAVARLHTVALAATGFPSALDIANTEELNYFFRPVQTGSVIVTPPSGVHHVYFCNSSGTVSQITDMKMCHANGSVTSILAYFGQTLIFQH
jgi:hypothetical protein